MMEEKKIGNIKEELERTSLLELEQFIRTYSTDERGGVVKLGEAARKRLEKYEAERTRTEALKKYGFIFVAGLNILQNS